MADLTRLLQAYSRYRAADRNAMSGIRPGIFDVAALMAGPDAVQAMTLLADLRRCNWIDAYKALGFSAA